jgi:hypothetical protein
MATTWKYHLKRFVEMVFLNGFCCPDILSSIPGLKVVAAWRMAFTTPKF